MWDVSIPSQFFCYVPSNNISRFRWVFCQMETLRACRSVSDIKRALDSLPATLDETYERILSDMCFYNADQALSILTWLVFSDRPLSLEEVAEGAVIRPKPVPLDADDRLFDIHEVLHICRSLVTVSEASYAPYKFLSDKTTVVRFTHLSVQEYLLSGRSKLFVANPQSAHTYIGGCCLFSLLQIESGNDIAQHLAENKLFRYVARHWHTHRLRIEGPSSLDDIIFTLFSSKPKSFAAWLQFNDPETLVDDFQRCYDPRWLNSRPADPSPLYCACILGLCDTAERLIDAGADINEGTWNGRTPLHGAIVARRRNIVAMLLRREAPLDCRNNYGWNPLGSALHMADLEIVKTLLNWGAGVSWATATEGLMHSGHFDMNFDMTSDIGYWTDAEDSAIFLLDHAISSHPVQTVADLLAAWLLEVACRAGMSKLVKWLLEVYHDGGHRFSQRQLDAGLYHAVILGGNAQIINGLIQKGADANALAEDGILWNNALIPAALSGDPVNFDLIVNRINDLKAVGGEALRCAAGRDHYWAVVRLLDLGVEPNSDDELYKKTPLHLAATHGHG